MNILRNKRDFIKWCHTVNYSLARQTKSPPSYPVAVQSLIGSDENMYPQYWTKGELQKIVNELSIKQEASK